MLIGSSPQPRYSRLTLFFAILGTALIILGIMLHIQREMEKEGMQEVVGTLISFSPKDRGEGFKKTGMCPRVRFHTLAQIPVTVEGRQCTNSSRYKVGDPVTVFYSPEHPEQALLVVTAEEWFYVVLSCGFGVMMWVFACCTHTPRARAGFNKSFMDRWYLTLSLGGIALVLCGVSFWVLQDQLARQARMTEITTGAVIVPGHGVSGRNSTSLCALIEFQAADQQSYTVSASVCSSGYDLGDRVPVRYDPVNPRHAMLDSFWDSMFNSILLFFLSFPFLVVSVLTWLLAPRRNSSIRR